MSKTWPPSPMVEDEVLSLAKEHLSDLSDSQSIDDLPPPDSRGAVDQYPLIIDANEEAVQHETRKKGTFKSSHSQPLPSKPKRNSSPNETRFVHISVPSDSDREVTRGPRRPRSKSTIGIATDEDPRGRPQVSRLRTDLGADLQAMATGQRRTPSPYSYRASTNTLLPSMLNDPSKVSLLSPESAESLPIPAVNRRARSQRPERIITKLEGSDSDSKRRECGRRRSKSRHDRGSFSKYDGDAKHRTERSQHEPRRSERSPPRMSRESASHRTPITPPQTPGFAKESPSTSAAEESDRRRSGRSRVERRLSKESSYDSAAEERQARRDCEDRYRTKSRRQSMHRPRKPPIDLIDPRIRPETPSSRTPRNLEDDLERAFKDNQKKPPRKYAHEQGPSPFTSPLTSPPRTPRADHKPRDYFEMTAPTPNMSKQRSRPPSLSDNPIKPMTTLLGAATLGAAAAKSAPNFSRSSTTSLETPSTGSQGSIASGQRSRKPSPVPDESQASSRHNSTASSDGHSTIRQSGLPPYNDRPLSRAGSVTSQDGRTHPSTASIHENRPSSRNGLTPSPVPHPHPPALGQRASSYSTVPEQAYLRPSTHRTNSTIPGPTTAGKPGLHKPHPHSGLAQPPYIPSPYVSSPASETASETVVAASAGSSERGSVPPISQDPPKKQINFPLCPHKSPVAGTDPWYTIARMTNFDICVSCMRVLGESRLRDYCVPSPWKSPNEPVTCALSRPWVRIVVAKCLKDSVTNIGLLQSLTSLPPDVYPCPGRQTEIRRWYHVVDPDSKAPVHGFNVCTACVRNAELIFPEIWREKIFERPEGKLAQERYCNLYAQSKHFYGIVTQLDILAGYSKKQDLRNKDISKFGEYVRQRARYRECAKDAMLATPLWHYMPSLPEFTICEECYMEVVWPLSDKPIGRDVVMTLQKVPIQRPSHYVAGISCQLYSERMRKIFKDAVLWNDFEGLRSAALTRYNVEHKLQDYHRRYELEQQQGHDRRADIERNIAYWKQYE